jgi:large subunit ribosomal protein L15
LEEVNVSDLERVFSSETSDIVGNESFWEAGLIRDKNSDVKILGRGKLTKPLTVKAHRFSASARAKIEEVGGKTVS